MKNRWNPRKAMKTDVLSKQTYSWSLLTFHEKTDMDHQSSDSNRAKLIGKSPNLSVGLLQSF